MTEEEETLALKLHRLGRTSFRAVKNKRDYLQGALWVEIHPGALQSLSCLPGSSVRPWWRVARLCPAGLL